jgi:hypothetical protein
MWITTVNYNASMIRESTDLPNILDTFQQIRQKRSDLQAVDLAGDTLPEFPEIPVNEVPLDATTIVIKRAWNQETSAREFADFINQLSEFASAIVEEQI